MTEDGELDSTNWLYAWLACGHLPVGLAHLEQSLKENSDGRALVVELEGGDSQIICYRLVVN
jgi:hypothetical protein